MTVSWEYPDIVGKDAALQNLGEVSNRGVDIELSWNDKIGKDFRYYIRPNLTFSRNRLEYKAEVARKNSWRKEPVNVYTKTSSMCSIIL